MRTIKLAVWAVLVAWAFPALAAPPYDVVATVTAPTTGGPVESYELQLNGVAVPNSARQPAGPPTVGANNYPELLPADGTYTFVLRAINAAGSAMSAPVVKTITPLQPPGPPSIEVQVNCTPCVITSGP